MEEIINKIILTSIFKRFLIHLLLIVIGMEIHQAIIKERTFIANR